MGVNGGGCGAKWNIFNAQQRHWAHNFDLIYEKQERVFHWDIQTRENNGEYTSTKRESFFSIIFESLDIPVEHELELFIWLL